MSVELNTNLDVDRDKKISNIIRSCILEDSNNMKPAVDVSAKVKYIFTSEDELVDALNKQTALVTIGGKVLYVDTRNGSFLAKQACQDLLATYAYEYGDPARRRPAFDFWLKSPRRREYARVVFEPNRDVDGAYNLWTGFALEPLQGECTLIKRHILDVICDGDGDHFRWLFGWLAQLVQEPGNKPGTAIVVRGAKGCGKSTLASCLTKIFGSHAVTVSQPRHLVGSFNSHFQQAVFVVAEEGFWAGDRQAEGVLKDLITGPSTLLERKGVDAVPIANHLRLMVLTNSDWAVPATQDERRFFVVNASDKYAQDTSYFRALNKEIDEGGAAALLDELLVFDYSGLDLRNPPKTDALADQVAQGFSAAEKWLHSVLEQGEFETDDVAEDDFKDWATSELVIAKELVHQSYNVFAPNHKGRPVPAAQIGRFLKNKIAGLTHVRPTANGNLRKRCYVFPSLEQLRADFTAQTGVSFSTDVASRFDPGSPPALDADGLKVASVTRH